MTKQSKPGAEDPIVSALKTRYFALLAEERWPETPKITEDLDKLEKAIFEQVLTCCS
jgi:hypothetical protein